MSKRKHTTKEIINKLGEAEVVIAAGSMVAEAAWRIGADLLPLAGRVRWSTGGPGPASEATEDREQSAEAGGGRTDTGQFWGVEQEKSSSML